MSCQRIPPNDSAISVSVSPAVNPVVSSSKSSSIPVRRVNADFVNCPLSLACAFLSRFSSVAVGCSNDSADKKVNLIAKDLSFEDSVDLIARQCGLDIVPVGDSWLLTVATDKDNIIITGQISGYSSETLKDILSHSLNGCFVSVAQDGYVVVSSPISHRKKVEDAISSLKKTRPMYAVKIVVVSNWLDVDLLDGSASISASRVLPVRDWFWGGLLVGSLQFSFNNQLLKTDVTQIHNYNIIDGEELKIYRGTKQPVARHSISDSGTNSISGYDVINIGDTIRIVPIGQIDGSILVSVYHENSNSVGFVGDYPISDNSELSSSVRLNSGDIYCIGDYFSSDSRLGVLRLFRKARKYRLLMSITRIDCI